MLNFTISPLVIVQDIAIEEHYQFKMFKLMILSIMAIILNLSAIFGPECGFITSYVVVLILFMESFIVLFFEKGFSCTVLK